MIVFNLDPPYIDIGTSTRAGGSWQSVSSPSPQYIIIGLTPTVRRGSNRSSGRQSGVREPVVVPASRPPTSSSSAPHHVLSNSQLFRCLLFTFVLSRYCSARRMRHSHSQTTTMSWHCCIESHDVQCIIFGHCWFRCLQETLSSLVSAWVVWSCHFDVLFKIECLCVANLFIYIFYIGPSTKDIGMGEGYAECGFISRQKLVGLYQWTVSQSDNTTSWMQALFVYGDCCFLIL